ncbi:family 43 glycosylhydrolase [Limosilactobacillus reuteri]|uniref:family 43 glycosylhydrolase n=1 Tax=Limosilactobacillus reuteri TaxID=1598 RepID=UPI002B05FE27|nr:family 43 glycosylhydrolase [Limosilactobacillus reuteri]
MPVQVTHNNDGHFYTIDVDIAKEGAEVFDLSTYFKARVADNHTGLRVRWFWQGQIFNTVGKKPRVEGVVGQYSFKKGSNGTRDLVMSPDAPAVAFDGDIKDCEPGGYATYYFPGQMFPQEGLFKGTIGLVDDLDEGAHYTSVDIWFKVYPQAGGAQMGRACDFYISELDKAIKEAEDDLIAAKKSMQKVVDDFTAKMNDLSNQITTQVNTDKAALAALETRIEQDNIVTKPQLDAFEQVITSKVNDLVDKYSKKFDQGLATIADKANYNYDAQLDSPDNILFPAFTNQNQNSYRDELYISNNGVDLYHVNQYGSGVDFTDHPVAVDCSTMFYNGYVYQIYDYAKSPYPEQIQSHFLGGNGIQIRRSKDMINWEFIDVDLPSKWLQTWAPEWYVEDGNVYVVVSLSDCSATVKNTTDGVVNWVKQTYIISTTDFKTWSEPQFIDLGLDNCIDPFIIKENGHYYLFVKNEVTGKITEFKSDSLAAGYKQIGILDTNSRAVFEGPAVIEYKGGYLLIVDAPNEGLVAFYSTDIESWGQTIHLSTNDGQIVKHCTPITLKNNDLRKIVQNYVKTKAGQSPFAVSNQNTKKLSYIYPGQTKVSLFPNTLYVAQSNVTSEISITDYDTNLLRYGDTVEFALMSGNYSAKVLLAGNPNQQVWLPTTLELSAAKSNSNSIVTLECTNLGLVPQVYQSAPSFVYSRKTVDLKDAFAQTGGEYKPTADGYLMITVKTSGNQYLNILWADLGQSLFANTFQGAGYPAVTVPIRAQNTYRVEYNVDQIVSAKFFYTEADIQV